LERRKGAILTVCCKGDRAIPGQSGVVVRIEFAMRRVITPSAKRVLRNIFQACPALCKEGFTQYFSGMSGRKLFVRIGGHSKKEAYRGTN
jgi:hypothetical protein